MDKINKKILIVEDDKNFLWILRQSFENQGLEVLFAQDGQAGLLAAEKEKPDLIIIDIMLPKMDGIEMAKRIKEKGVKSQMVFLTNLKDAEHISQALSTAGQKTDYIVKSDVSINSIVDRVKDQLGIK
ncbi:MAG: response regulator [Candidatus Staskawiczbacteria bacterium]|nr:response regulator [Candidatus Staskawiczbacteria bacterium]